MFTVEVLARRLLASRYASRGNSAARAHLALSDVYLHRISVLLRPGNDNAVGALAEVGP
jgi:hypothetical protein